MPKLRLRSLFDKTHKLKGLLETLESSFSEPVCVMDSHETILFGQLIAEPRDRRPIQYHDVLLGHIMGGTNITAIAFQILNTLLSKEAEKKVVGKEVLELYREINLIYNFSEQLANNIAPPSIASLALEELKKIMHTSDGFVILSDKKTDQPILLAEINSSWTKLNIEEDVIKQIVSRPHSEILTREILDDMSDAFPDSLGSLLYAPLNVKDQILGAIFLIGDSERVFTAAELKLLTTIALQAASAIERALLHEEQIQEARAREETMKRVQEMTSRFVPFEFLKSLGRKSLLETELGDQVYRHVTVMFMDIRKFTSLAELMTPEENFKFVLSFNARMGPIIKANDGFVNQYLGDGLMAIFLNNAADALRAAVKLNTALHEYNEYRLSRNRTPIRFGLGIHTGPLIMGITGDEKRWEAATISDTVNTAARIESLTKYYKCRIILSEQSYSEIQNKEDFDIRSLGVVQVKGRQNAVRIYECFDGDPPEMITHKKSSLSQFNTGIRAYEAKSLRDSIKSFSQVLVTNPDDETAQCFLGRISNILTSEFNLEWNGVDKMPQK
ncbi:MAG: adenylate/guanylate cyclase [Bacteroidetes bacterium]|nr:MAG: adenylate/guanylate cyclase [Bacteroidota bacterium]